ncbi:hypothetical protein PpBr36_03008 [Pyricularia pennisetigena]|uniref:hypothetical protein n=1 Tax=Pyricularia pennisetigena TaxID=1578925 RepID=UPI00114F4AF8|nr:hypothetical protein PpBr36_03008 [Pyricularia pennisetigena]TLS31062.1 hypothetical protein PpBr36_03008 [Pyricularia pennisetigena]
MTKESLRHARGEAASFVAILHGGVGYAILPSCSASHPNRHQHPGHYERAAMSALGFVLFEAYSLWLKSVSSCASCAPSMIPCLDRQKAARHEVEKADFVIYTDQPAFIPPPSLGPLASTTEAEPLVERPASAARRAGRRLFSVQKRLWPRGSSSARRPRISAPTNFQHISSGSLQFPPPSRPRQRRRSFRPLELSIYSADNYLSPMLPHFEQEDRDPCITSPQPVHIRDSFDSDASTLTYQESFSSSFHIPRRPLPHRSVSPGDSIDSPPRIPSRSRLRAALTSPERVEMMVERIASAMIEKETLQSDIDHVVERQSIYTGRAALTAPGVEKIAPMPSIPATPAAAPSFAQRLSLDRPQTAPQKAVAVEISTFTVPPVFDVSQLSRSQTRFTSQSTHELLDRPIGPSLPLVFRPPLRKKKSFSHVSTWLSPNEYGEQYRDRGSSFESAANEQTRTTENNDYYTYATVPARRASIASVSSMSSWSAEEEYSYVTTLSPPSTSPVRSRSPRPDVSTTPRTSRMFTFGRLSINSRQHWPHNVGIAY